MAAIFTGRTHYYEGRGVAPVVHAVRTAAKWGASTVVLTNGCGGLNPAWGPGTVVLLKDHINLTGATPLHGANFVDLTDAYSPALRDLARTVDPDLDEGVYVQFAGPQYETPAEVRMAGIIGGGGLGKIAIDYGYYRYKYLVMLVAVVILVLLVQLIQGLGDRLVKYVDHR